jgi:hypothetical protein
MSFLTTPKPKAAVPAELDPTPRVFSTPELVGREHEHEVIRHDDDTDASYAARCELVNLILAGRN